MTAIALLLLAIPLSAGPAAGPPSGGLAAQPIIQQVILEPGAEGEASIVVRNESADSKLPVQLLVADLDASGKVRPASSTPQTLVGSLTLPTQEIVLAPREVRKLAIRVHGDGHTRFGAIILSGMTSSPSPVPFARIVLQLVIAPTGPTPEPQARLSLNSQGTIALQLTNPGPSLCQGRGALFLLKGDGSFLGRLDVPEFALLPGGATTVTMRWPAPLPSGTVARAVLAINGRSTPSIVSSQAP